MQCNMIAVTIYLPHIKVLYDPRVDGNSCSYGAMANPCITEEPFGCANLVNIHNFSLANTFSNLTDHKASTEVLKGCSDLWVELPWPHSMTTIAAWWMLTAVQLTLQRICLIVTYIMIPWYTGVFAKDHILTQCKTIV